MTRDEIIIFNRRLLDAELRALRVQPLVTAGLMATDSALDDKLADENADLPAIARSLVAKAPSYALAEAESAERWAERIADEAQKAGTSVQNYLKARYARPSELRRQQAATAGE